MEAQEQRRRDGEGGREIEKTGAQKTEVKNVYNSKIVEITFCIVLECCCNIIAKPILCRPKRKFEYIKGVHR